MTTMKKILDEKGYTFFFVPPDATVAEAVQMMARKRVGLLLVVDGEELLGVFSERDVVKLAAEPGGLPTGQTMRQAMVHPVAAVHLDTSVDTCMALMSERGIRHVPVMDGQMVLGVVSVRDVVKEVVHDREATIKGLENYIVGTDFHT